MEASAARGPRRRAKARPLVSGVDLAAPGADARSLPPKRDETGRDSYPEMTGSGARLIPAIERSAPSTQWAPPPPRGSKRRPRVVKSTRLSSSDFTSGVALRIAPAYLSADEVRLAVQAAVAQAVGPLLAEIETLRSRLVEYELRALVAPPAPAPPPAAVPAPSAPAAFTLAQALVTGRAHRCSTRRSTGRAAATWPRRRWW